MRPDVLSFRIPKKILDGLGIVSKDGKHKKRSLN